MKFVAAIALFFALPTLAQASVSKISCHNFVYVGFVGLDIDVQAQTFTISRTQELPQLAPAFQGQGEIKILATENGRIVVGLYEQGQQVGTVRAINSIEVQNLYPRSGLVYKDLVDFEVGDKPGSKLTMPLYCEIKE